MEALSLGQERAVAAIADRVYRERLAARPPGRGRPPKSEGEPAESPAPQYSWLPAGQRLATLEDVMRALAVRRTTAYELMQAGYFRRIAGPGRARYDPRDIEACAQRLCREGGTGRAESA